MKKSNSLKKAVWRSGSEFLGGVLTGLFLGWVFDNIFLTKPWGIVIGLFFGVLTGYWNIYRLYKIIPLKSSSFTDQSQ